MRFFLHEKAVPVLLFTVLLAVCVRVPIQAQTETSGLNTVKPAVTNGDLVIRLSQIGKNAVFFPADVDGTRIEVLAVRAPDGTVRTAFNTCQVCYGSGRGFYKQSGSVLVCQNCGNRFRMGQVGMRAGGCNPVPIPEQYKKVTESEIVIPLSFLKQAKEIFANWKRT
jgi:uncharacterized membrane protein